MCTAVLSLILVCLFPVVSLAQGSGGTILGTVADETGGVLPGVEVTVTNLERGTTRTVISDDEGRYRAPEVQLGDYEISAALTGFQTAVRTGITMTVGRQAVVDLVLSVGAISERVVVTGEAPTVNTTSSTISGLVDERKIRDLPLNGRSFSDLALLQMGISKLNIISSGQGSTSGFGTKFSVSGARPSANSFLLDGNFVNDTMNNTPAGATGHFLGVETLREFSVLTNTYSAEYGQSMGGIINAVTKSGTNQLHGSAFYFHRNDNLDARNFFDTDPSTLERSNPPEFKRHQFGGTIGGPIVPNKTFIFGGYEGLREALGRTLRGGTLTEEARQGIFPLRMDGGVANCDELTEFGGFMDADLGRCIVPLGGPTEPGGPSIADYMIFFPAVNSSVPRIPSDGIGEYILSRSRVSEQDNFVIKADHNFSDSDSFFVRYTFDQAEENNPGTNFAGIFKTRNQYVTLEEKHIFSPTLLNVARVGFNRNALTQTDIPNFDFPENLQQVPTGRSVLPEFQSGLLGVFTPTGTSGIGGSSITPRVYRTNLFEYADNLSWSSGRHSVKVGFNLKRIQANMVSPQRTFGSMQFNSFFHFLSGGQTVPELAGSLSFPIAGGNVERGMRYWVMGFFAQDDYQIRPNLTLNLGLRYEPSTGHSEVNGKLSAMINLRTDLETTLVEHSYKNPTKKNFAPRIGFAWDPSGDGKTSVRAGFGMFYNIQMSEIDRISTTSNPPFTPLGNPRVLYPIPFEDCCTPEVLASNPNATTSLELIDWNAPQSYRMQWNLNVQRELVRDTTLTVGYVGSRGVDLFRVFQKNSPDPVDPSQCGPSDGPTCVNPDPGRSSFYFPVCRPGGPGGTTCDRPDNSYLFGNSCANFSVWPDSSPFRCHRLNPKFQTAIMRTGGAGSTYHGLQLSLNKRFSSGFQIQGSYTWSHSIDNSSKQIRGPGESAQTASQQNGFDTPAEKGNSNFDVPHNFTLNYTVDLPGQDMSGVASHILGGWQLGGIVTLSSGVPQTIVLGYDNCRCINGEIFGVSTTDNRPDLISGGNQNPVLGDGREPEKYFDPTQFEPAPAGFYGQLGRNTLRIPGVAQFDFSLVKKTLVAEGTELQFRAEFFNILNRANFGSPGTRLFARAGTENGSAGRITGTTTTSRQIQLALKILF
jgi:hypothetical protein